MFCLLLSLRLLHSCCNLSQLSFVLSICKHLHPSLLLSLHCQQLFCLFLICFEHLSLSELIFSLIHDCCLLLRIKAFKMVWLDSVGSKRWLLSSRVFCHEIMGQCKILVMFSLHLLFGHPSYVFIPLLLCHLCICLLVCDFHISSCLSMLLLCFVEKFIEMESLLSESTVSCLLLLFKELLLTNLLRSPVGLL